VVEVSLDILILLAPHVLEFSLGVDGKGSGSPLKHTFELIPHVFGMGRSLDAEVNAIGD